MTPLTEEAEAFQKGLNAPFGARCFMTLNAGYIEEQAEQS